jgi:hypothetical protein
MPKGHGNRMTKPPSPSQKRNGRKWGGEPIAIVQASAGYPDKSWWLGLAREDFDREAAAQVARMKLVK